MKKLTFLLTIIFTVTLFAQVNPVQYTPAKERLEGYSQRIELQENSLLKNVELKNIGPTVMSGRVVDLDVSPTDPSHFYTAYASGGLWKTENNGISFTPIFDDLHSMTIGDIAVDWKNNIIYVGTGENNSSRSSYAGTGLYKSTDGGKTWEHLGLEETHRTGRIIIDPENPNYILFAALGHLYSPNPERGVFKSTDGGKTWNKTLYVNENTGAIDLVVDPKNKNEIYASMWERERRAWNFVEGGSGSGIYKSTDGGSTWNLISGAGSGFPTGENAGRIGLDVYNDGSQKVVYAFIDNQERRPSDEEEEYEVTKDLLRTITPQDFLKLSEEGINSFLDRNNFPQRYNAAMLFEMIESGKVKPKDLVDFLADANTMLFDTPVVGGEVYASTDGGDTWEKRNEDYIENFVYSYGYYFGEIRVAPYDENKVFIMGVPILRSDDGGKTYKSVNGDNVHADHHAMWINPVREGHHIIGNDGGVNITYDDGETWFKANTPPVGQFYTVQVDMAEPYNVYGGLQDNGVWKGPHTYSHSYGWYASGQYAYDGIMGGDGMKVAVDTRDNETIYTGYQFGNYYRINESKGEFKYVTPQHELGESPYRWNWQTPVMLSVHNRDIYYMGSSFLHRSFDKGDTWEKISPDLTKGGKKGDVPYGTLTTLSESKFKFGLIYAGSDDGLIHVTKDGGNNWQNISKGLPADYWVSRVEASRHDIGTVYASLNGYRWDNFDALVYKSTDYGHTWKQIGLDLPDEPVNVVREDPKNPDVIYVGTDHGLYVSLNGGESFMGLYKNLPHVPVHDLVIHPRENDLIIGTHGRSIWLADVEYVQALTKDVLAEPLHLFPLSEVRYRSNWGMKGWGWGEPNEPSAQLVFYTKQSGTADIKVYAGDLLLAELTDESEAGLNFVDYSLTVDENALDDYKKYLNENSKGEEIVFKDTDTGKNYLRAGTYTVKITINGTENTVELTVKPEREQSRRAQKKTP